MTQATPAALWPEKNAAQALALGRLVNVPPRMGFEWNWGDPLPYGLAFTGDANRTWVDANGVVQPAPRNMNQWSEDLSNAWYTPGAAGGAVAPAVTANAGAAPDGNNTASKAVFVAPGSGDSSVISTGTMTPVVAGAPYTGSFYVKAFAAGDVGKQILFRGAAGSGYTTVTLTTAWQRVSATETAFTTSSDFEICLRPAEGGSTGTVSVLIWGVQFQPGSAATTYLKTTTATVFGPRNDGYVYDKNGLLVPAWLIEAAAINGLLHSEQFDAWSAVGATVSANAATAPDGNATADKIIDSSNAALQLLFQTAAIPNDGGPVTVSIWLKAGTSHIACVELDLFNGTGVNGTVIVDLNAGTIINGVAPTRSSITPFPNGWYRVSVTITNNTSGNTGAQVVIYPAFAASQTPVSDATVTGDVYAWGAQVETNPVPTSYIPTTSATVLRAGETASVPWGFVPSASVMYATFVEVGGALVNGGGIIAIGDATNFLLLSSPGGVGVYNANYTFFPTSNLAAPVLGDVVELRAVLTAAGGISAGQSLDGAAETTTSTVAGPALPVAWHSPRLSLCGAAGLVAPTVVAFQTIRLALGNWSMDQMRKLAVDPNRSTFSPTGTPTGSLVSNARGYAVTPGDLTGTGKVAFVRNGAKGVIY